MATLRFADKDGKFEKTAKPKYVTYKKYLYLSISINIALTLAIILIVNKS